MAWKVAGNSRLDLQRMRGERITARCGWGKHFLVAFPTFAILLFGSYRINDAARGRALTYRAKLGRAQRRAFFCEHCRKRYVLDD